MLSDVPPRVLANLCRAHGRGHLLEQGRCRAMLADVCGGYRTEVFLLDCVARERLVKPVQPVGMPVELAVSQLANQIVQELRVDAEAARWAAEAWATAMEWTPEQPISGKAALQSSVNAPVGPRSGVQPQRVLVEGILRSFDGSLGDLGVGAKVDNALVESLRALCVSPESRNSIDGAWATVRFLTFTRQPRGLVFTDHAIYFLNPAAAADCQAGSWAYTRLQELGARRRGLQEICLSERDDRMSLEATGIPVGTMMLFLHLVREVVGPFLVDHDLPEPPPLRAGKRPRGRPAKR